MKKTIFILLLLMAVCPAFANRIDQLETDAEVERFMGRFGEWYRDFSLFDPSSIRDSLGKALALKTGMKPWQKADLNGDGRTDLLVINHHQCVFIVTDDLRDYKLHLMGGRNDSYFPVIAGTEAEPELIMYIVRYKLTAIAIEDEEGLGYRPFIDTVPLRYYDSAFVEHPACTDTLRIEKIEFATTQCLGTCPAFSLEITADRKALYIAEEYNELTGTFQGIIDAQSYQRMTDLLQYICFPVLEKQYSINATDHPAYMLTITYNNGLKKEIYDYGPNGSFGLKHLYSQLFALRDSQKWRRRRSK